jgi:hypothetical protein
MRRTVADCRSSIVAGLIALLTLAWPGPAAAGRRVALVIGNSAYQSVARQDNPRNDAGLIADTLAALGFTLVGGGAQLDLDKASLDKAVQNFGRQIQGTDVTLFYYAGHGVQVNGDNYLVPVDANATREADVDFQMLDVNKVLNQMRGSGTRLNIVIAAAPPAATLRPDPDRIPIRDAALLRELSDRLYEHNFDPEPIDGKGGMQVAISAFQARISMTPTGEATEGLLMRLRKLDDLKPWGSIV